MKTITIPLDQYECLRGHLEKANEIFKSLGLGSGASEGETPKISKKRVQPSKTTRTKNYLDMIEKGERGKKPDYLKK